MHGLECYVVAKKIQQVKKWIEKSYDASEMDSVGQQPGLKVRIYEGITV